MKNTAIICLSPYKGGMELDSVKTAKFLLENGNIYFICKENTFLADYAKSKLENKIIITISFRRKLSIKLVRELTRAWREKKIQNIIFFGASELGSIFLSLHAQKQKLIIQHGTTKDHKKKSIYHKIIYRRVDFHIAVSNHIARNVLQIIPTTKEKIKVIPTSTDVAQLTQVSDTNAIKILHVGRIVKGKGQIEAIKACDILYRKHIPFEFKLIGAISDKAYFQKVKTVLSTVPYQKHIHLINFTDRIADFYSDANILLFPSHGEGMSNVVLEALGNGLQCICFHNTSLPELKSEYGLHLYLAKNLDINDLRSKLLEAVVKIKDDLDARRVNQKIIRESFSIQMAKGQFLKLLD